VVTVVSVSICRLQRFGSGVKLKREAVEEWSGEMGARIAWVLHVCVS